MVPTLSDRKRLEAYGSEHYKVVPCLIKLQDGREVDGSTFLWNEDKAHLREGTFDLKDWPRDRVESRSKESSPPTANPSKLRSGKMIQPHSFCPELL